MAKRTIVELVLAGDAGPLTTSLSAAEVAAAGKVKAIANGMAAVGSAFTAAGATAVSYATDLNKGLAEVATLIPGQEKRLGELRSSVQDLAKAYGTPTEGLTAGLYESISAFGDSSDTVSILETNVKAAKAGVAEVGEAIALTSAVTKSYNAVNEEGVQKAADLAFKTVELGQTNFPQLAAAIGQVAPISAALGVSQEELFGVMATGTGVTGTASQVSTQLRGVLAGLMQPTGAMAGLYKQMGVESGAALIEQEGLQGALLAVTGAAKATGEPLGKYLGSVEAQTLALALTGGQMDNWVAKTAAMTEAAGSVDVAFAEQTEGVNAAQFKLDQWKQTFVTGMQNAGQAVIDFSGPLATGLLGMAEFGGSLSQMAPQITALWATLGGGPAVFGAVSTAARGMWTALTGPVGLVVAAIAAVGTAAWVYRDELVGAFRSVLAYVQPWVDTFLGYVETAVGWIPGVGDDLSEMVGSAREKLAEFTSVVEDAGEETGEGAGKAVVTGIETEMPRVAPVVAAGLTAAPAAAEIDKAAEDAAKKAMEAFWSRAEAETKARVAASQLALRSTTVQLAMEQAGSNAGLGFSLAFADGPGGVHETIPQEMMTLAGDGSWMIAGGQAAEEFSWGGETGGAGGFLGKMTDFIGIRGGGEGGNSLVGLFQRGFDGVSGIMSQFLDGDWKSTLATMVTTGLNTVVPGLGTIANQAFGMFKRVFDWFKKPSETEIEARNMWGRIHDDVVGTLRSTAEFSSEVARAMAEGWDRETAEMRAAFVLLGQQAGLTYDEAFGVYAQYEQAVRDGNTDLMRELEAQLDEWERDHGTAFADVAKQHDEMIGGMKGGVDGLVEHTWDALQEMVGDFEWSAEEIQGGSIWPDMIADMMGEVDKLQWKVDEATADMVGNMRSALGEMTSAFERYGISTGALGGRFARMQALDAISRLAQDLAQFRAAGTQLVHLETTEFRTSVIAAVEKAQSLGVDVERTIARAYRYFTKTGEFDAGQDAGGRDPGAGDIDAVPGLPDAPGVDPGAADGIDARQRGGPVWPGAPFLVGELGPELFVPHRSGTIIPHGAFSAADGRGGGRKQLLTIDLRLRGSGRRQFAREVIEVIGSEVRRVAANV